MNGVHFDFTHGLRVIIPSHVEIWQVRMIDQDTGFEHVVEHHGPAGKSDVGTLVLSPTRYYTRWHLIVMGDGKLLVDHVYSPAGKRVLIKVPSAMGDTLSRIGYVRDFQRRHACDMTAVVSDHLLQLFNGSPDYAHVRFVDQDHVPVDQPFYAMYSIGHFPDDPDRVYAPYDQTVTPMTDQAAHMLGLPVNREPPRIRRDPGGPPVAGKYACIAVHATTRSKYWNNPAGWNGVVAHLKAQGYQVFAIDYHREHMGVGLPEGVIDLTGPRPLTERARFLRHADVFVGCPSGLAWLAWAAKCEALVLVSGFSHPNSEFATPYRVQNPHVCNSCWNDQKFPFDKHDAEWCPRQKNFECTREISVQQVTNMIDRALKETR